MNCGQSIHELSRAVREGSTLPARTILCMSSLFWGLGLLTVTHANWTDRPIFENMRAVMGQHTWAAVFILTGLCLLWRIIDYRSRVGWSHFVNSATFGLWVVVTFCRAHNRFEVLPVFASDLVLVVTSLWVALRTSITTRDRETA